MSETTLVIMWLVKATVVAGWALALGYILGQFVCWYIERLLIMIGFHMPTLRESRLEDALVHAIELIRYYEYTEPAGEYDLCAECGVAEWLEHTPDCKIGIVLRKADNALKLKENQ